LQQAFANVHGCHVIILQCPGFKVIAVHLPFLFRPGFLMDVAKLFIESNALVLDNPF
jgi:hypothetical protein